MSDRVARSARFNRTFNANQGGSTQDSGPKQTRPTQTGSPQSTPGLCTRCVNGYPFSVSGEDVILQLRGHTLINGRSGGQGIALGDDAFDHEFYFRKQHGDYVRVVSDFRLSETASPCPALISLAMFVDKSSGASGQDFHEPGT